jgi:hypothetical protein
LVLLLVSRWLIGTARVATRKCVFPSITVIPMPPSP